MEWSSDLKRSMAAFDEIILPELWRVLPGEYIRIEGTDEEIAKMLDQQVGIDGMIDQGDVKYGLANRIQIDTGVWNTFTIRLDRESGHMTEYEKLKNAIEKDGMRPHLTLQAYIVDSKLMSFGVARTKDIIAFIDKHGIGSSRCPVKSSYDGKHWAKFVAVKWTDMAKDGYHIRARKLVEKKREVS